MKVSVLLAAFIALFSLSSAAQAASIALGNLSIGDEGDLSPLTPQTIDLPLPAGSQTAYGYATGAIPSFSRITFSYTFVPSLDTANLKSQISYTESGAVTYFYATNSDGFSYVASFVGPIPVGYDTDPGELQIVASADSNSGRTVMTNLSAGLANFSSYLLGALPNGISLTNVHWVVEAVPLPAALPLFGLGLAGLAGYSRRKKLAV
jgi:hypothetical protein